MTRKVAFFDIDGTLINVPNGINEPTQKTIHALTQFQKEGNLIFIATARGSLPFSKDLISFDGFIGNDGHYILYNNEVLIDDLFTIDEISHQFDIYQQFDGRFIFSGHQNSWSTYWEDEYMMKHTQMFSHTTDKPANLIEQFEKNDIQAIACCVLFKNVEDLRGAYHALKNHFTIVAYETGLIRMDVYRKGFTKGSAVKYVYEKLGISKEDTYAFGDGINDKEMIQLVGNGIAMGNAIDDLKNVASYITDSVDDEGIANYFWTKLLDL